MKAPEWLNKESIRISLDARPLLASGQHPLDRVISETASFKPGEIYEIITPFTPVPMIEKIGALGFESYSENASDETVRTYFCRI
jgi:hypothetical protein